MQSSLLAGQGNPADTAVSRPWSPPASTELSVADYDLWRRWFPTRYCTGKEFTKCRRQRQWKDFPDFAGVPAQIRAEMDVLLATLGTAQGFDALEIRTPEVGPDPALFGIKLTPPEDPRYSFIKMWGGPALTTDEIRRGLKARERVSSLGACTASVMIISFCFAFFGALGLKEAFLPILGINPAGTFGVIIPAVGAMLVAFIAAVPPQARIRKIKRQFSYAFA